MSSEKFENVEEDYRSLYADMKRKIEIKLPKTFGEEKKRFVREVERNLDEANIMLQEMEAEARISPHPFRSQLQNRCRLYRQDVRDIEKKLESLTNTAYQTRQELFSNYETGSSFGNNENSSTRGKLLQANNTLDRTSQSVARSQVIAAETDQIGTEIIDELGTQKESLQRTKTRLVDTDENLSKSRKILRSMYRRRAIYGTCEVSASIDKLFLLISKVIADKIKEGKLFYRVITNKLILVVIIIMEVGIFCGVVYWKFFT